VFLVKYRIEFILSFPFIAALFTWYAWYGLRKETVVESPEKLYKKWKFILYTIFVVILILILFFIDIPGLRFLMEKHIVSRNGIMILP